MNKRKTRSRSASHSSNKQPQKPEAIRHTASSRWLATFMQHQEFAIAGFALLCLALLAGLMIDLTGGDYPYFLPRLFDSHLFYLQNGLAIQEYTASFCAGIFNFANPQSLSLSLPQALSSLFGPVAGMQATYLVSSALAGIGIYYCARFWGLESMPACMAAIAMSFSGLLLLRITTGHLTFYSVGFAPVLAALLLYGIRALGEYKLWALAMGCLAGLLLATLIYGGMGILILQVLAIVVLILLVCGGFDNGWLKAGLFCLASLLLGLLVAAPKIEAVTAMNEQVQRSFYPLPGFGIIDLPIGLLQGLFWVPDQEGMNKIFQNKQFYLPWHEFYYGFTPISLAVIVAGLIVGRKKLSLRGAWHKRPIIMSLIAAILLLPIVLNIYQPDWNQFLKSLPVIGQSSSMSRFFILYIPVLALLLGWSCSHWRKISVLAPLALTALLAVYQFQVISTNLEEGPYDPSSTVAAWASQSGQIPPVSELQFMIRTEADGSRRPDFSFQRDHSFIQG
ncbi:MAG: hypothetical protein ACR2PR_00110, partial [Pseudohongiellaceae bacterium]